MNDNCYLDSDSLSIKITPEIVNELRNEVFDLKCQECGSDLGIGCVDNICYVLCKKNPSKHCCGYDIKKDYKLIKKPYIYKSIR